MNLNITKLARAIEESKYSKAEIALRCNIDRKTIENVLSGRDPKLSTVLALASVLDLRICYLFDEEQTDIHTAGRDYVERGNIEHNGPEHNGCSTVEADLRDQIAQLKSQLADKERIIKLLERQ